MTLKDWLLRFGSRKFVLALLGAVVGLIVALGGPAVSEDTAAQVAEAVSGAALLIASVLGYVAAEGKVDAARESAREWSLMPPEKPDLEGPDVTAITVLLARANPTWGPGELTAELRRLKIIPPGGGTS